MLETIKARVSSLYARMMPRFWLAMKPQYQWAFGIAIVVALWLATGLFGSHKVDASAQAKPETGPTLVRVAALTAQLHDANVIIRGRTQALHAVDVRTEVDGEVQALHFERGDRVKEGAVLCQIKVNDRAAKLAQADAQMAQTQKELEIAEELYKEGFRSKTQLAQAKASYEAARAGAATMRIQLDDTKIRAPFAGVADDRYVDVGDYMRAGDKCATVMAPEPFLVVGTVSEEEVGELAAGTPATAKLVTGQTVQGKVRFVARRADPATRTFRVEIELPNAEAKLRDGVSADVVVPVQRVEAHKISPGILVLDDNGTVGVRTVVGSIVRFMPVRIISDGPDGMWIAGLPQHVNIITVGQEFVSDGQKVKAVIQKAGRAS